MTLREGKVYKNIVITKPQLDYLKAESKKTGLTESDLIRRALDAYIIKQKKQEKKK